MANRSVVLHRWMKVDDIEGFIDRFVGSEHLNNERVCWDVVWNFSFPIMNLLFPWRQSVVLGPEMLQKRLKCKYHLDGRLL